jgi:hypothetical protein
LRINKLTSIEQVSFKKRNKKFSKNIRLYYGKLGFIIMKTIRFEYSYFYLIKRFLKYFFKVKYALNNYFKIWVFLKGNFPISKKSKNSRMGKGKGSFFGWLIKLQQGHTIIEFSNINDLRLQKLCKYWNKTLNFKVFLYMIYTF